jgi:hypothetical protein
MIDHAIKAWPPNKRVFLLGTPLDPDLAGIKATTLLITYPFRKIYFLYQSAQNMTHHNMALLNAGSIV